MGLDGLGSSAYGPEAALTILIPLGAASLAYIGLVMVPILLLLAVLYFSYRQTIKAYPSNGGAYTVTKENLGTNVSLLAAAALVVDYVLNVAVGISAGVAALVSVIPALQPHILALCLAILAAITLMNLRGTAGCRAPLGRADLFVRGELRADSRSRSVQVGDGRRIAARWFLRHNSALRRQPPACGCYCARSRPAARR